METRFTQLFRFTAGMKTATLVVVLGSVAVLADHAFFIAPHAQAPVVSEHVAALPASLPGSGFTLAESLHPTQADVEPPPSTF